jgi:tRNA-specific 2-thiouridylase
MGASHVATGHYARLTTSPIGVQLLRGKDHHKDQSYFLFGVPQRVLGRFLFPLGDLVKDQSRAHARRLGLPNADKPDSQELCFVPDGNVRDFVVRERGASVGGPVKDEEGQVLGKHDGIAGFTVGQRKGLGLGGGAPTRYVLRIVPDTNEVVVGDKTRLYSQTLRVTQASWLRSPRSESFRGQVRIRYRHEPAPATIVPEFGGFRVEFDAAQRAATPGQAAVVYDGEQVVAGGFIVG